jgi:hypothetical protein
MYTGQGNRKRGEKNVLVAEARGQTGQASVS